ncbi:testis-expressed protein 22 isoform X2 [Cynocephalus volans]|uniref:testis-expressed protein 22 isoform X2 n=1 Tax=Cynocephalus volans TaxID=110931 RepID=UPI002FC954A4
MDSRKLSPLGKKPEPPLSPELRQPSPSLGRTAAWAQPSAQSSAQQGLQTQDWKLHASAGHWRSCLRPGEVNEWPRSSRHLKSAPLAGNVTVCPGQSRRIGWNPHTVSRFRKRVPKTAQKSVAFVDINNRL